MKITTERLLLRPFEAGDAQDLFEYLKKPAVNCFACEKTDTVEEAEKIIAERSKDDLCCAIVLKENGKVIGEIYSGAEGTDPEDLRKDTYSPCWMLNESYWGKGYMTEAARAYVDYLFNVVGARRVYTYTEDYNLGCQKVCEKLGMRKEGEFKEFVSFVNDENGDPIYETTLQYAILKKEWTENNESKVTV